MNKMPALQTQDDSTLLRLELIYAALTGLIKGHNLGLLCLGIVSAFLYRYWHNGMRLILFIGLGQGFLMAMDAIIDYIKTHRRGLGLTWSYPPKLIQLVRFRGIQVIAAVIVDIIGIIVVRIYIPMFWDVVLGSLVIGFAGGANAYHIMSQAQKQRSNIDFA